MHTSVAVCLAASAQQHMFARLFFFVTGVFAGVFADQNYQLPRLYPYLQKSYLASYCFCALTQA